MRTFVICLKARFVIILFYIFIESCPKSIVNPVQANAALKFAWRVILMKEYDYQIFSNGIKGEEVLIE
jgi:hypothetical protein